VTMPQWTLNTAGTPGGTIFDPAGGFTLQLYAGLYGLSSFPSTFDHSFIDTTRIFVVGNGEAPVPDSLLLDAAGNPVAGHSTNNPANLIANNPAGVSWFVFTDPSSGKTYAAQSIAKVADGSGVTTYRNDTGARMLQTALTLSGQATAACTADPASPACAAKSQALSKFKQNIDVMRSLHNAFGYASYKTDAPFYY
jgi:hypothetical protein